MTKALTLTENKNQNDKKKPATINLGYTTITDRLGTVNWSNDSHTTGVVKPITESQPSH